MLHKIENDMKVENLSHQAGQTEMGPVDCSVFIVLAGKLLLGIYETGNGSDASKPSTKITILNLLKWAAECNQAGQDDPEHGIEPKLGQLDSSGYFDFSLFLIADHTDASYNR